MPRSTKKQITDLKKVLADVPVKKNVVKKTPVMKSTSKKVAAKKPATKKPITVHHEAELPKVIPVAQTTTVMVHRAPESCSYPHYGPKITGISVVTTRTSFVLGILVGVAFMSALTLLSMVSLYSQVDQIPSVQAATIQR